MGRNRAQGSPLQITKTSATVIQTAFGIDTYYIETEVAGAAVSVTLDPNAANGDQVLIQDVSTKAATYNITIIPSEGQTIGFGAGDLVINTNGGGFLLTYLNSDGEAAWLPTPMAFSESGGGGSSGAPNFVSTGAPPAVAETQLFQATGVVVGPSGKVYWTAVTSLDNTGGTAVATDQMQAQATLNGETIAGLNPQQLLGSGGACSITTIGVAGGLTVGSTVSVGVECTDVTTPTHTFTGGAQILYWNP